MQSRTFLNFALVVGVLLNRLNYRISFASVLLNHYKSEDIFLVLEKERGSHLDATVALNVTLIYEDATLDRCRVQNTKVVLDDFGRRRHLRRESSKCHASARIKLEIYVAYLSH